MALVALEVSPAQGQTIADDIGLTELRELLGEGAPTGAGVPAAIVEVAVGDANNYLPDVNDPDFAHVNFDIRSGASGTSSHAQIVAERLLSASGGVAPGITEVVGMEAIDYLTSGYLEALSLSTPHNDAAMRLQNHSWIATTNDLATDRDVLQRLDYAIGRDNVVAVVGLNNGSSTTVPVMFPSAYNVISVGVSSGNHSRGGTRFGVEGRLKPDIVAPDTVTSFATPVVTGVAALLLETAADMGPQASKPQTIKAILMAGATKEEFPTWTQSTTQPLDPIRGAGEVNALNSYNILSAGDTAPGNPAPAPPRAGWAHGNAAASSASRVLLEVPEGEGAEGLSIALVWHREVEIDRYLPGQVAFSERLDDLSLRLHTAEGGQPETLLRTSDSAVDNVEHIHVPGFLPPGQYILEVENKAADGDGTAFSLAWRADRVELLNTYAEWSDSTLAAFDPSLQAPLADPDRDGKPNELEYLEGTDPAAREMSLDPVVYVEETAGAARMRFAFQRRLYTTDAELVVAVSQDLENWDTSETLIEVVSATPTSDPAIEQVVVELQVDLVPGEPWFIRLISRHY